MSINPNRPVQPSADFKQSLADINKVTHTAIEAVADLFYDADGDKTGFNEVKEAFQELSTQEKVAFSAGGAVLGTAIASLTLVGEKIADVTQEAGKTIGKEIGKRYKNPPEAKMAESLKQAFNDVVNGVEKFVDNLANDRTGK